MSETRDVVVRDLTREECEALLARHQVGRLAYVYRNHVEIVPIHYVFHDGWIYLRSAMGKKLVALQHAPWAALEVDEIESFASWTSVVVHGSVQVLDPEGPPSMREALATAVEALRAVNPNAFREGDPVPERSFVLRISPDRLTGRASSPAT